MKRILLLLLCLVLAASSVFGYISADEGLSELDGVRAAAFGRTEEIKQSIELIYTDYETILANEGDSAGFTDPIENLSPPPVKSDAETKLEINKSDYDETAAQYKAAEAQLNADKEKYAESERAVNATKAQIESAEAQIAAANEEIASAKAESEQAQATVKNLRTIYSAAKPLKKALDDAINSSKPVKDIRDRIEKLIKGTGFTTVDELIERYEVAEQSIKAVTERIAAAEDSLSEGNQKLEEAKTRLADDEKKLSVSKTQLDESEAKFDAAKTKINTSEKELANAQKQLATDKKQMDRDSASMVSSLKQLDELDDERERVELGLGILLQNPEISARVTEGDDCPRVLALAAEYVDEQEHNVGAELETRTELYELLVLLAVLCAVTGLVGIVAVIIPRRFTLLLAALMGTLSVLAAIGLNAYGKYCGYDYFVYKLPDGSGSGDLQHKLMLLLVGIAALVALAAWIYFVSYRRAYKQSLANAARARETEFSPAISGSVSRNEEPFAEDFAMPEEDESLTAALPSEPSQGSKEPDISAKGRDAKAIDELREKIRKLNDESDRLESERDDFENSTKELEAAQQEYLEALRRFEKARDIYNGNMK